MDFATDAVSAMRSGKPPGRSLAAAVHLGTFGFKPRLSTSSGGSDGHELPGCEAHSVHTADSGPAELKKAALLGRRQLPQARDHGGLKR